MTVDILVQPLTERELNPTERRENRKEGRTRRDRRCGRRFDADTG